MKLELTAMTSRCAEGNMDTRIVLELDTAGQAYGSAPPTVGAINAALDGARKAIVAAIEADRKGIK